jgi:hypothetical protein
MCKRENHFLNLFKREKLGRTQYPPYLENQNPFPPRFYQNAQIIVCKNQFHEQADFHHLQPHHPHPSYVLFCFLPSPTIHFIHKIPSASLSQFEVNTFYSMEAI